MPRKRLPVTLSLDPGIAHIGHCVFIGDNPYSLGLHNTEKCKDKQYKTFDDYARIISVMQHLDSLVEEYDPCQFVAEMPIGGARNAASVKYLAMATAVVAHLENKYNLPVHKVTVHQLKKLFVGPKAKGKGPIIRKAIKMYPHLNWPTKRNGELASPSVLEHSADALAAFIAWRKL